MPEFLKKFLTELNDSDKGKVDYWLYHNEYQEVYEAIEDCVTDEPKKFNSRK